MLCGVVVQGQTPITTAEELAAINVDAASLKGRYILMNDIAVENWTPIGDVRYPFLGVFDGNGYTITVKRIGEVEVSPAGVKSGVKIANVETMYVGVFGFSGRRSVIRNLRVEGEIVYEGGDENVVAGGVTGANYGTVENCVSYAAVTAGNADNAAGDRIAGGIAGINNGIIRNCYSTGEATATGGANKYAGGITGLNDFDAGSIQWCFATGNIEAEGSFDSQYAGGIAGLCARGGTIQYCVAMNEQVAAGEFGPSGNSYTGPIAGHNMGRMGGNFHRNDMTLTADKRREGRDRFELSSLQEMEWWTVNRHIRFAFGDNNARPWAWNDDEKRPALYWEDDVSAATAPSREQRAQAAAQPPKEINTVEEMAAIGADQVTLKKNYILMRDLTLENWTPIGKGKGVFTGRFDGNGRTITIISLDTDTTQTRRAFATAEIGLFSVIGRGGTVENLHVTGDLAYDSGSRTLYMGAIAGENAGSILRCASTAHLDVHGGRYTSGRGWGQFAISTAMNSASPNQTVSLAYMNEACGGGIAGLNKGVIKDCYTTGDVTVSGDGFKSAGGIVGRNGFGNSDTGEITQCYAMGTVIARGDIAARYAGGIAGLCMPGNVTNCVGLNERVETTGKRKGVVFAGRGFDVTSNIAHGGVGYNMMGKISGVYFRDDMLIYNEKDEEDEKENRNTGKKSRNLFQNPSGEPLSHSQLREEQWWAGESSKFRFPFGSSADAPWAWDDEFKCPFLYWEMWEKEE
jgi:hypothetical protein